MNGNPNAEKFKEFMAFLLQEEQLRQNRFNICIVYQALRS